MTISELLAQFIPAMLSAIYTFFLTLIVTVIQVLLWPVNLLITSFFPDISAKITEISVSLANLLSFFPYVLSFLPPAVLPVLIFAVGTELVLMFVFQSSYYVDKVWKVFQHIKFW